MENLYQKAYRLVQNYDPYNSLKVHSYHKEPTIRKENTKKCKSCKHCKKESFRAWCNEKSKTVDLLDFACCNYTKRKK